MTREYKQRLRAEASEATRARIVDAVLECLEKAPLDPVSMDRVAEMARVSRSTIYTVFGDRAGLFDAASMEFFERSGYQLILDATALPGARDTLRGGIAGGVEMFAANRDVACALYSMARLGQEGAGGAIRRNEARRAEGMAWLAGRLAEQDLLRPGLSTREAADLLWMATSFDAFDLLYSGRGLPKKEVSRLLIESVERAVLNPGLRPAPGS